MTHHQPTDGEGYLDGVDDHSPSKFEWRPGDVVLDHPDDEDEDEDEDEDDDESTGLEATS